jgi:hypothetical protein
MCLLYCPLLKALESTAPMTETTIQKCVLVVLPQFPLINVPQADAFITGLMIGTPCRQMGVPATMVNLASGGSLERMFLKSSSRIRFMSHGTMASSSPSASSGSSVGT